MPLPVLADMWQVRLNWNNTNAPRDASNNLYFFDSVGTQTATNLAVDFAASVNAQMWGMQSTPSVVTAMTITPLDGVTAGAVFPTGGGAVWLGGSGTDAILQGSTVISIKSGHRGPSGRGRVYLPWTAESTQLNGVLTPANVTSVQTGWNSFFTAMVAAGWSPSVVSTADAINYPALNYTVRPNLMTQRRRARR